MPEELRRSTKIISLAVVLLYGTLLYLLANSFFAVWSQSYSSVSFTDYAHDAVVNFTNFLSQHRWARSFILGFDSFLIDVCAAGVIVLWMVYGVSKSLLFSIVIFYSIRTLGMSFCQWPLPKFIVFEDPGFPSLLVSYAMTNDLYFSGHTGIMTILVLETWLYYRSPAFFALALFALLYTVFTLAVLQAHFINDILIGFVTAVWIQQLIYRYRYSLTIHVLRIYTWAFKTLKGRVIIVEDLTWYEDDQKRELF